MSHWAKIPCKYKDKEALVSALGVLFRDVKIQENHSIPNPYKGYPSSNVDISCVTRWKEAEKYGVDSDIHMGFKKNQEGLYELVLDEHCKQSISLQKLSQEYAKALISLKFRGKYSVSSGDGVLKLRRIGS
jgi:hypothetical protein